MTAAECLRKYMQYYEWNLSPEAKSLLSQMETNKSLVDEWMKEEFEKWASERRLFIVTGFYAHILMYLELNVRLAKFEAEKKAEVIVSEALFKHTEKWLKESFLGWAYKREEKYSEGCGGLGLSKLFALPDPKAATPNIRDVSYKQADFTVPFIQMAAKVVAIEVPALVAQFELQQERKRLQTEVLRLRAEIGCASQMKFESEV
eukprot:Gregarina_sp_Pseudo_9__2136@NODE_2491_length_980_cov_10_450584_g2292_i0_p1_GENE_NODE_2491_length_980_cov_10_450584_g2292_i0NODE_2491_length_980_cov_10_450584_g2292_i0_p1_ORF_typecomplete_len204_score52_75HALZ/PF02183_18/0_24_NODE_2491_length_980_cov_10_450584_g2292_i0263874